MKRQYLALSFKGGGTQIIPEVVEWHKEGSTVAVRREPRYNTSEELRKTRLFFNVISVLATDARE
jgi:hypothetical protein